MAFVSDSSYECTKCGRIYRARGSLMRHLRYECGQTPKFKCPFNPCEYSTKHRHNLRIHCLGCEFACKDPKEKAKKISEVV